MKLENNEKKQEISNALELIKKGKKTLDNYSGMFRFVLEKRIQLTNKKDLLIKLPKSSKGFGLSYDVSDDFNEPNIETVYFTSEDKRNSIYNKIELELKEIIGGPE